MIVDSSALIAILRGEPEEHAFRTILEVRQDSYISAGTLIESRILAATLNILREFNELIAEFAIRTVPVDEVQAQIAAEGFLKYGKGRHTGSLNFGDLF